MLAKVAGIYIAATAVTHFIYLLFCGKITRISLLGETMLTTVLISFIYCAVCVLLYFYADKKENAGTLNRFAVGGMLFAAAAIRVFFAFQDYFFTYDMSCFKA